MGINFMEYKNMKISVRINKIFDDEKK